MRFRHGLNTCLALTALAGIVATAAPASAQIGEMAGFTEVMNREYFSRDLAIFAEALEMDDAQQDILETLFQDYQTNFEAGKEAMQDRLKNMKDELQTGDKRRILSMIFVPFEDWGKERRKLGDEFLNSVMAILNSQQLEMWPAFKRQLVREKTLSKGVLAGESLNLLHLVRDLDLTNAQRYDLQPVLDEYEIELDQALRERNDVLRVSQGKMVHALQEQDAQISLDLVDEQLTKRIRVREVNDRYITVIAAALPAEFSEEFRHRALEQAYPKAYRPTPGQRMYDAALTRHDEISEEVLIDIGDLRMAFFADLEVLAERITDEIREHEPKKIRNRVEMYTERMTGGQPRKITDTTLEIMQRRDQIDDTYIELLQAMLTEEQFTNLPGADRWMKRREAQTRRATQIQEAKQKEYQRNRNRSKDRAARYERGKRMEQDLGSPAGTEKGPPE